MLRSSRAASHGSVILFQPPTRRRRMAQRRTAMITTILGVAAASVIAGAILARGSDEGVPQKSPLSYLPL